MTPSLVKHLEGHLGQIQQGWAVKPDRDGSSVQVVRLASSPVKATSVLSTLGLSKTPLRAGNGGKRLRQELVAMYRTADGPMNLPDHLHQLGSEAIARDTAYPLGHVIGPRGLLHETATVSGFFVSLPILLPESFQICRVEEPVVFAWLVPITDSEAEFIRTRGLDEFQEAMEAADPDVMNMSRPSIV